MLFAYVPSSRVPSKPNATVMAAAAMLAGCLAALPALAETGEQSLGSGVEPQSTTLLYQFPGLPIVRISTHGNLLRFEGPTGYDHIGIGELSEGYVLCYGASRVWDTGSSEFGWAAAAPASCSGQNCTVTRTTSDGRMRLVQTFRKDAAERSLTIEMRLTNLGPGSVTGVILRRQADLDVDTGGALGTGDFTNFFGVTDRDSVFAWNAPNAAASESHAVLMRNLARTLGVPLHQPKVTSAILDNSCSPANAGAAGPVNGDFGATIQYNFGTMAAGRTVFGRMQYERN